MRKVAVLFGAAAALLVTPAGAFGHVSASAPTTGAGEYALVSFSVPHGCDGKGTTSVEIQIEEDIASVTPFESSGWTVKVSNRKPASPIDGEHGEITEVVDVITYTRSGGALPDGTGSVLPVSIQLPEDAAGETIYFPTVQNCEGGAKTSWINKPEDGEDPHSVEDPSPALTVTESGGGHGAGSDDEGGKNEVDSGGSGEKSGESVTHDHVHDEISPVRIMAFVAIVLGALGLILALLGLRGRSKENRNRP